MCGVRKDSNKSGLLNFKLFFHFFWSSLSKSCPVIRVCNVGMCIGPFFQGAHFFSIFSLSTNLNSKIVHINFHHSHSPDARIEAAEQRLANRKRLEETIYSGHSGLSLHRTTMRVKGLGSITRSFESQNQSLSGNRLSTPIQLSTSTMIN